MTKYINPANNYEMTDGGKMTWLWCLLFGPFYFASRRNWTMVFCGMLMGIFTLGLSWFIIPFFVYKINRKDLLMKGYRPHVRKPKEVQAA